MNLNHLNLRFGAQHNHGEKDERRADELGNIQNFVKENERKDDTKNGLEGCDECDDTRGNLRQADSIESKTDEGRTEREKEQYRPTGELCPQTQNVSGNEL